MQSGGAQLTTPVVRTAINPASLADSTVVAYLNTNKAVAATSITVPDTVYFTATFLATGTLYVAKVIVCFGSATLSRTRVLTPISAKPGPTC